MLGIKFTNSTTCKIDGWLRTTINKSKPSEKDPSATDSDHKVNERKHNPGNGFGNKGFDLDHSKHE